MSIQAIVFLILVFIQALPLSVALSQWKLIMEGSNSNDRQGLAGIVPPLGTGDPAASAAAIAKEYNHHLVVHFDINETILVGDEAGGDTRNDCLNKVLAKSAFVRMPHEHQDRTSWKETQQLVPTHWWDGSPIAAAAENNESTSSLIPPPLYIGWTWPKGCCAYYRTFFKKKSKTFVLHDGSPYRSTFEQIQKILQHDAICKEIPVLNNMLPAFFHTLQHLSKTKQKKTIVLRTFGTDLPDISAAVTAFAQGKHPDYPDFCNPDWVMTPDTIVKGRWLADNDDNDKVVYQLFQGDQCVAAGDAAVLDFIHSRTICGIQDDYTFWNSHGEEPWAGKPVWKLPDVHHVLLDDNIHNLRDDSIASVRQRLPNGSFKSLTDEEISQEQGRHLIRVPTIAPILHPDWFLEVIAKSQERFVEEQDA